jgi:hypothetical protein
VVDTGEFGSGFEGFSETFDDFALKRFVAGGPFAELYYDFVANDRVGFHRAIGEIRQHDFVEESWVIGLEIIAAAYFLERSDYGVACTFDHSGNAAGLFGATSIAAALESSIDRDGDAIAMESHAGIFGRDLNRIYTFAQLHIGLKIGRAASAKLEAADELFIFGGKTDAIAFDETEFTFGQEQTNLVGEGLLVFFLQAELPGQIGFVGWCVAWLLDVGEEAIA